MYVNDFNPAFLKNWLEARGRMDMWIFIVLKLYTKKAACDWIWSPPCLVFQYSGRKGGEAQV